MPSTDEVRVFLQDTCGLRVVDQSRLANDTGDQIKTREGPLVNVYDTGKCVLGGKRQDLVKPYWEPFLNDAGSSGGVTSRNVFVVYGHDEAAKRELETLLRRWNLEPLLLDQLPSEGQTLIEKLEKYRAQANFAVVLATPDDEGHARDKPDEKAYRARQNVVLELGMMLAHLGRARVAILIKNPQEMERPSDIQGLIYIPFERSVDDAKVQLAQEMDKQGIPIDLKRL